MKHRYILLLIAVMLIICSYLFTSFYNQARQEALKHINNEQLLHARQAARGIEDFFDNWTRILTALAASNPIINMDKTGKENVELLFRANQDKIRAISRVDRTGRIIYTFPENRDAMGRNIAHQEHIREIMGTHEPVVSDVFSAVQGYETVALHVPVFKNKTYEGTIAVAVNFQALAKRYLENIKIGDTGYAWMTSRDGTELYCPVPGHTGKSVFENCKDFPSILVMAEDMLKGRQGLTTYVFDKIRGDKVETIKKHAVYMPIKIGNTFWSIVVASSEDEIIASLEGFRNKLIGVIAFLLLGGVSFAYFGLKAWFIIREEENRRSTEEVLRESEHKYRLIAENTADVISVLDMKMGFTYVSPSIMRIFGFTVAEALGLSLEQVITPESLKTVLHVFAEEMKLEAGGTADPERVRTMELEQYRKDGSLLWVESSVSFIRDQNGKPLGILAVTRDINERKKVEIALRREQEFTRLLFETSPAFIVAIGADGKTLMMNKALLTTLEYTEEEIKGRDYLTTFVPEEDRGMIAEVFLKIIREGEETVNENRIRSKTGLIYPVEWHGRAVMNADKGSDFFVGVGIDISKRKQTEEALKKFQFIVENAKQEVYLVLPDGRISYVNQAVADSLGYTVEEIIALGVPGFDPKFGQMFYEHFLDLKSRDLPPFETIHIARDGRKIVKEMKSMYLRINEEEYVCGFGFDITERKRIEEEKRGLEERLSRAEKMEALGTLAGGVAHDLNNVLGVVVGYAELLLNTVDEESPIRPRLLNIMRGGERAAAIVEDLLTLARRGVPGRQVVNLNDIINQSRKAPEFANLSSQHPAMRYEYDLDPELLNIAGSPVHISKTLYNLIANAGEAMADGGVLTIKTANNYLDKPLHGYDEIREGDYVVLSVSDTGEGIPEADLKRIFEPFYTKKVMGRSGTGLGLAVVWGTVKDLQGYINVESEEGKGSVFTLYFPVTREKAADERIAAAISEYLGKGESVLVVDDVKEQRDLAAEMLVGLNYSVTSVASGEEALTYLGEHKVDLMVLDMIMDPGMDGLDTYRNVLAIRPGQKAVIVSGFSETYRVNAAQALGAGAYVRKPYIMEKLGLAVRKELDRTC
ncbi:MAG: PAS domain S-box protein [Syntrophales bacterium]